MTQDTESIEQRRKRLKWRANHRGMKEMDLMIGGYANNNLANMDQSALDDFEAIIDVTDAQLSDWLTDKTPTPRAFQTRVFAEIKAQTFQIADYKKL